MSRGASWARLAVALLGVFYPFLLWGIVRAAGLSGAPALQLVPAALSLLVCVRFARTLRPGAVPQIEQFARAMETEPLPDFVLGWLRGVTRAWVAFLAINTLVCLALAVAAPVSAWALWTGAGVYLAMALLLAGEYAARKPHFRWYREGFADRLWARAFPAERTERGRRSLRWARGSRDGPRDRAAG